MRQCKEWLRVTNCGTAARCTLLLAAVIGFAAGGEAAIVSVTHGGVDLTAPPSTPAGQVWRYGLAMPIQLDATTAGLLVNIRRIDTRYWDFEVGTDLIKFDRLDKISASGAVPISRSGIEPHPSDGRPSTAAKYPMFGGFVPRGAKLANGAAHPCGGTGFGLSVVGFYPADLSKPMPKPIDLQIEMSQFRYDGGAFTASPPVRYTGTGIPVGDTGWAIVNAGLSPAIADGNDLLHAVSCRGAAGVARFQYFGTTKGWQPVAFVPVTDESFNEPSLVRDVDGSLLFTARNKVGQVSGNRDETDIPLWRSIDGNAGTWRRLFIVTSARQRTPLSVNRSVDGTLYIATNTVPGSYRGFLQILPINAARTGLETAITVRDASSDFGAGPEGKGWMVDHPISNVVRLADGQWHCLLAYRVLARRDSPAAPCTGLYVEEVFSSGTPRPDGKGGISDSGKYRK